MSPILTYWIKLKWINVKLIHKRNVMEGLIKYLNEDLDNLFLNTENSDQIFFTFQSINFWEMKLMDINHIIPQIQNEILQIDNYFQVINEVALGLT